MGGDDEKQGTKRSRDEEETKEGGEVEDEWAKLSAKKQKTAPAANADVEGEPNEKCFIGNLSWDIDDDACREFFKDCGTIVDIFRVSDSSPSRARRNLRRLWLRLEWNSWEGLSKSTTLSPDQVATENQEKASVEAGPERCLRSLLDARRCSAETSPSTSTTTRCANSRAMQETSPTLDG